MWTSSLYASLEQWWALFSHFIYYYRKTLIWILFIRLLISVVAWWVCTIRRLKVEVMQRWKRKIDPWCSGLLPVWHHCLKWCIPCFLFLFFGKCEFISVPISSLRCKEGNKWGLPYYFSHPKVGRGSILAGRKVRYIQTTIWPCPWYKIKTMFLLLLLHLGHFSFRVFHFF